MLSGRFSAHFIDLAYAASQSYRFFEGWTDGDKLEAEKSHFLELKSFFNSSHDYKVPDQANCKQRFRVISFLCLDGARTKLSLPEETYEHIKQVWHLLDLTAEIFINNNGVLPSFETQKEDYTVMKVAASQSIGMNCISISRNRKDGFPNVLLHRLKAEESIFKALESSPERCRQPAFFATVIYRCHQQRVEVHRHQVTEEITRVEHLTKLGGQGRLFEQRYKNETPDQAINSDSAIKKLSYIQTELAVLGHVGRSSLDIGQWLVELAEKDREHHNEQQKVLAQVISDPDQQPDEGLLEDIKQETTARILDEIEYTRRCAKTVLSQLQATKDRVDSQTNLVGPLLITMSRVLTHHFHRSSAQPLIPKPNSPLL